MNLIVMVVEKLKMEDQERIEALKERNKNIIRFVNHRYIAHNVCFRAITKPPRISTDGLSKGKRK